VASVLLSLAVVLLVTSVVGYAVDRELDHEPGMGGPAALAVAAVLTGLVGLVAFLVGRKHKSQTVSRREATFTVATIWIATGIAGALPFWLGSSMSLTDALFESVSGFTTTGATVLSDIEAESRSILLWRSMIQWLGGMGIVVLFVAVFPSLGVGAKHMIRGEVPGTSTKGLKPRIRETATVLWRLYAAFTVGIALVYWALGMDLYEAVCHAFTTISTGGFSTRNDSIAAFDSPSIEVACSLFMLAASVNYGLYYAVLKSRSARAPARDTELRVFFAIVVICTIAVGLPLLGYHDLDVWKAFRHGLFAVATLVSSTGYGVDDPAAYPSTAVGVLLLLMFVGGCAGSTAGGIKVERIVLVAKQAWRQLERFSRPRVVRVIRMGGRPVDDRVMDDVAAFLTIFVASTVGLTIALAWVDQIPLPTAFGAAITCIANMGPAPYHVGPDNFVSYSHTSKLLCIAGMLLGRLEFFTLLALLSRNMWRR
jgi:trk system potassium uptake protein TrkH